MAKVIDQWTVVVVRLLRGSPVWRLGVVAYLLCLHVLVYLLLGRMQHSAIHAMEMQRELNSLDRGFL